MTKDQIRVLVVGAGNMGSSHAKAYNELSGFKLAGICARSQASSNQLIDKLGIGCPAFDDYPAALEATQPDAVCIATWPESHAEFAERALKAECHVFVEKPLATSVEAAGHVIKMAEQANRKVVVGYILRHHPSWRRFIAIAKTLGKPLVMRMNLNQQSSGSAWETHKRLLASVSPIVDCGVHYVDVMCQMVQAEPVRVSAIGARLTEDLPEGMVNYGQLQVTFSDGSVGWYEAGWGPMMSETAFFVKDCIGPDGSVSIVAESASSAGQSANVEAHTQTQTILQHPSRLSADGEFAERDDVIRLVDEPDHDGLCKLEQQFFLDAILNDMDLSDHLLDALASMRVVLAADESFRTGRTIEL